MPDLDHKAATVQTTIKAYLDFLKNEMGYTGWRYDMVKGFHGWHVGQYNDASTPYYSVGECWGSYTEIKDWIIATEYKSTGFDFANKYAINDAFATNDLTKLVALGQPAGIIGDPALRRYATTFIDNHDTGRTTPPDDHSDFVGNVAAANAYMLCNPGVPCVWMSHWLSNKQKIKEMIDARKTVRLHSQSTVNVISSAWNLYVAETFGLNGSLIVKIGSASYSAPVGYTLATSGTDYAIWTKATNPTGPKVVVTPAGGTYLGGTTVTLSSTNGVAPVKIYYTTDGSVPTASSTLYSSPISITVNNTVLKAIAIDNNGTSSNVSSNTYITATQPGIILKFKAPASWSTAKCHVWGGGLTATTWPGNSVTKDANGYYTQTISGATSYPVSAVFNNGAYEQTVDLSASTYICWDYGTATGTGISTDPKKYSVTVAACAGSAPIALISPASGNYPGGTTVTLSSTGGAAPVKIYYTTDGSTPSASSNLYSVPFSVTVDNTTVKAIAIDNGSVASAVVSATYTTTTPTTITVRFKAPASWTTVKVYAWTGTSTAITAVWPGDLLTAGGDGLYTYTTPIANSGFNIIFNKGSNAEQTVDILNITSDKCYETTGSTSKYPVVPLAGCFTSLNTTTAKASIIVYPNPATESFILESDLNLSLVQIYSISGELVKSIPVTSNQEVIEIQDLPSGFYSVVAVTEEGVRSTTKLIKK